MTASLLTAACSGGASHASTTYTSLTGSTTTSTSTGTSTTIGTVSTGYGQALTLQTSDGYRYSVQATKFSLTAQPSGLEPAPPGKDYVTFSLLVSNPLSDRAEPITPFDSGDGQTYNIHMGAPLGDTSFNCSSTPNISPPTLPTTPPRCDTNDLTVSSDTALETGTVPADGTATIVYTTGETVPATVDLAQLQVYFNPPGSPSPPTRLPQGS